MLFILLLQLNKTTSAGPRLARGHIEALVREVHQAGGAGEAGLVPELPAERNEASGAGNCVMRILIFTPDIPDIVSTH